MHPEELALFENAFGVTLTEVGRSAYRPSAPITREQFDDVIDGVDFDLQDPNDIHCGCDDGMWYFVSNHIDDDKKAYYNEMAYDPAENTFHFV